MEPTDYLDCLYTTSTDIEDINDDLYVDGLGAGMVSTYEFVECVKPPTPAPSATFTPTQFPSLSPVPTATPLPSNEPTRAPTLVLTPSPSAEPTISTMPTISCPDACFGVANCDYWDELYGETEGEW